MTDRFAELVRRLEAAREVARRLVATGESAFVPVVRNLDELLALPRDRRFPIEVSQRRWKGMPFVGERGGGYTWETTPLMEELAQQLIALVPVAEAASPALQAEARRASDPLAAVAACHGHAVVALKWGEVIIDGRWLMPRSCSAPSRLVLNAPTPHLIGQTGASLWIVDLERASWVCLEVAPGMAGAYSFLDTLVHDETHLAYDAPVLVTQPEPRIEWRRKEVRLAELAWRACPEPDPALVARCRSARWEELFQFLAAYFGDEPMEVGVSEVVFVTADHPDMHEKYLGLLDAAIAAAASGMPDVAAEIERSFAASASDAGEARAFLERLRAEYLRQYDAALAE